MLIVTPPQLMNIACRDKDIDPTKVAILAAFLLYRYKILSRPKNSNGNQTEGVYKPQLRAAESLQLHPGDEVDYSYEVFFEKGRTTKELSGADIEYLSSHPDKAEIDPKGKIVAKHPGQAELSIRITLNGVTDESNKIKVKITGPF